MQSSLELEWEDEFLDLQGNTLEGNPLMAAIGRQFNALESKSFKRLNDGIVE